MIMSITLQLIAGDCRQQCDMISLLEGIFLNVRKRRWGRASPFLPAQFSFENPSAGIEGRSSQYKAISVSV